MTATWWVQATPGTTYWRCEVPAKQIGQALVLNIKDITGDPKAPTFPRQQGAAIWQFPGNTTRALLIAAMQEVGIRCLIEVDDDYTRVAPFTRGAGAWKTDRVHLDDPNEHDYETHRDIVRFADGVICSTPHLAEVYHDLNPNVWVCRNSIDVNDWQFERPEKDGVFRIGWAASSSHIQDQPLIRRALKWAAQQEGVEVVIFGGWNLAQGWKARRISWANDVADYRRTLVELGLDVGLCPLVPEAWAQGKSDVKALEYAMAGAMPMVSGDARPYEWWRQRVPACHSEKDWEDAIRWAVEDRDEVARRAEAAKEYVLAERTIESEIDMWELACAC